MSKATIDSLKNSKSLQLNKKVFIVHGHNETIKLQVERFLRQLNLSSVILHEEASEGMTVIEKFEKHASGCSFAIVLLTGDDIGGKKGTPLKNLKPRARQNVILELGFFIGKLGRSHVCVIHEPDVDIPSDYAGVLFLSIKNNWQYDLAKEMKKAGLSIDLNSLI